MDKNIFTAKKNMPNNDNLIETLGNTYPFWQLIKDYAHLKYPNAIMNGIILVRNMVGFFGLKIKSGLFCILYQEKIILRYPWYLDKKQQIKLCKSLFRTI